MSSCCVSSVSGPWKSVQEMANESFVLAELNRVKKRSKMTMKMFLSA